MIFDGIHSVLIIWIAIKIDKIFANILFECPLRNGCVASSQFKRLGETDADGSPTYTRSMAFLL